MEGGEFVGGVVVVDVEGDGFGVGACGGVWLAEAEPQLERIVTGNAAANQHMIAINEELGYELLEPLGQSYEMPVADLPG